ncbi:hypothetical protein BZA70DRAFT_288441 [Myxozyma melibiosi]|uniref:Uncharacterized protein n=1 Tax=Myxozyma melibiosi TaxID=54550 RepID=A0ABR1F888_9ASCO
MALKRETQSTGEISESLKKTKERLLYSLLPMEIMIAGMLSIIRTTVGLKIRGSIISAAYCYYYFGEVPCLGLLERLGCVERAAEEEEEEEEEVE